MYNFTLVNADTDSISFCKSDQAEFSESEQEKLLREINGLLPEMIHFEDDGIFSKVICLKAKNYILYDGKTIKQKGSSLKSSTLEPALKTFLNNFISALIEDKDQQFLIDLYHSYVKQIFDIKDIKPWCSKKTLSETTYKSDRANETKIIDAIKDTEYVAGDRIYTYFTEDNTLQLAEKFDGVYNKEVLVKKLNRVTHRFETIFPVKEMFLDYSLKRNKKKLEEILNVAV